MPLGTLDNTPPPLFIRGPSAYMHLVFFVTLSILLIVLDTRFGIAAPIRYGVNLLLTPLQTVSNVSVASFQNIEKYFNDFQQLQNNLQSTQQMLLRLQLQQFEVDELRKENQALRQMLDLGSNTYPESDVVSVIADSNDPFSNRLLIDKGRRHGIQAGSPVVDELGLIGQVTQVFEQSAEVTQIADPRLTVPVQIKRNQLFTITQGIYDGKLELRFLPPNADVEGGDELFTSGLDGVYPSGIPVGQVISIDSQSGVFAKIIVQSSANLSKRKYLLVLRYTVPKLLMNSSTESKL